MKKLFSVILLCAAMCLGGCSEGLIHGTDGLSGFGREVLNMELVGTASGSSYTTAWYASEGGDTVQAAVLAIKGKDTWEKQSVDTSPSKICSGVYYIVVDHGYSFCADNPDCAQIKIVSSNGSDTIDVTERPFVTYRKNTFEPAVTGRVNDEVTVGSVGMTFYALDKDGNVINCQQ